MKVRIKFTGFIEVNRESSDEDIIWSIIEAVGSPPTAEEVQRELSLTWEETKVPRKENEV